MVVKQSAYGGCRLSKPGGRLASTAASKNTNRRTTYETEHFFPIAGGKDYGSQNILVPKFVSYFTHGERGDGHGGGPLLARKFF